MAIPSTPPSAEAGRIIAAARRHFMTHGFRGVTMDDLATELGMSKKTLYAHFASKTALVEAVLRHKLAEAERELADTLVGQGADIDVPASLQALQAVIRHQTSEIHPAFVRDLQREAPALFGLVTEFRRDLVHRHFTPIFQRGRKAGQIRKDVPVSLMIEILVTATDALVNPAKLEQLKLSPKQAYLALLNIFLEGALARPGAHS